MAHDLHEHTTVHEPAGGPWVAIALVVAVLIAAFLLIWFVGFGGNTGVETGRDGREADVRIENDDRGTVDDTVPVPGGAGAPSGTSAP